jgi:hypothetical protein
MFDYWLQVLLFEEYVSMVTEKWKKKEQRMAYDEVMSVTLLRSASFVITILISELTLSFRR